MPHSSVKIIPVDQPKLFAKLKTVQDLLTPNKIWIGIFCLWALLLSGLLHSFIKSPGALQAYQLDSMLRSKQAQIDDSENQLITLQDEAKNLETNRTAQEREIRKVLGYAATNELIFDFGSEFGTSVF